MKTKTSFLYLLSFVFCLFLGPVPCALSQIPQGFNYQAIARDGTGAVIAGATLQVRFYIRSASSGGTLFYQELHSSAPTNSFGLLTLVIGNGTKEYSSLDQIDWSVGQKYLVTEVYHNSSWIPMGSSQLLTVPYAMTAGDITGTVDKLAVRGTTEVLDEALFEVKNNNGQTIFAVYNEGVRIYVDDGAKGTKGGFAVGGFDMTKLTKQEYLVVSDDSVRIYVDSNPLTKGKKSGFAVGGYDITKVGTIQNYLDVSADSVRIYIDSDPSTKKLKGGFSVGGYDMTKVKVPDFLRVTVDSTRIYTVDTLKGFGIGNRKTGVSQGYMKMTPINYFIGHESGKSTAPGVGDLGKFNSFMGYQSGYKNQVGKKNVFIGHQSGYTNNADYNVFIGNESGKSNNTGQYNTFLGYQSGLKNTSGEGNTYVGFQSGENNAGYQNTYVGYNTGWFNTSANRNVCVGYGSGNFHQTGDFNTFIGYQSGSSNTTGASNIFIGHQAGQSANVSSQLFIDVTNTTSPLLWGDFSGRRLVINGNSTHNINNRTFFVNGSAGGTGAWWNDSDARLKKDISTIENAVGKIMALRGVTFFWKDENIRDARKHMGFIAQEAESVIPEVVDSNDTGYSMQYSPITALLVEAFKEQQTMINMQQNTIESLQKSFQELIRSNAELLQELRMIKSEKSVKY